LTEFLGRSKVVESSTTFFDERMIVKKLVEVH